MIFQSKLKYLAASILAVLLTSGTAFASLTSESRAALSQLKSQNSAAAKVSSRALAVLVFPNVVKAGFIFGAQGGEGALFVHGRPSGGYRTVAGSYGLQAGVQKYGYALFFMNQKALDWVNNTRTDVPQDLASTAAPLAGRSAPAEASSSWTKEWLAASPPTPCTAVST